MPFFDSIKEKFSKVIPSGDQMPGAFIVKPAGFNDEDFDEKPPYSSYTIIAHAFQIFFIFLGMCCFAEVAAFQAQWKIGPSFLSGFAIFVSMTGLLLSAYMLAIPFVYWKYDRLKSLARPLLEIRVKLILSGFGTVWLVLISFITTISAWTEAGCQDPTKDPNEGLGKDFQSALPGWCRTKKAGAAFFWMAFCVWLFTLILAIVEWRQVRLTRPKDPPFTHPVETLHEEDEPFDAREHDANADIESAYKAPSTRPISMRSEEQASESPFRDSYAAPRQSMDTYGAFSDPAPTGFGTSPGLSRTMQYADPYAAIRQNLEGVSPTSEALPPRPPNPPAYDYTGYR